MQPIKSLRYQLSNGISLMKIMFIILLKLCVNEKGSINIPLKLHIGFIAKLEKILKSEVLCCGHKVFGRLLHNICGYIGRPKSTWFCN